MSYLPSDLTSRVGQEVTTGEIFRIAWRRHKRNFWAALGYLILYGLMVVGMVALFVVPVIVTGVLEKWTLTVVLAVVGAIALFLLHVLVWRPMFAGYEWAIVCTFDRRRMEFADLFYGMRTRLGCLASISFIEFLCSAVPFILYVAVVALTLGTQITTMIKSGRSPGPSFIGALLVVGLGYFVMWLAVLAIQMLFFLAHLFAFTEPNPSAMTCLRNNWSAVRRRFGQFFLVFIFPVLAGIAVAMIIMPLRIGGNVITQVQPLIGVPLAVLLMLLQLGLSWWMQILSLFLKASLFRAVCGYTLGGEEYGIPVAPAYSPSSGAAISPLPSTQPPGAATAEPGAFTVAPSDQQTFAPPEGPDSMQIDPQDRPPGEGDQ